jgi:bifunctional NMN adenylyltransferase/nudix hydrolase
MNYDYDLAVFIGRFQPFHKGHLSVVRKALQHARHVLILVGSANRSRNSYNPFFENERAAMIRKSLAHFEDPRVSIEYIEDQPTLTDWTKNVNAAVRNLKLDDDRQFSAERVTLIGHSKDNTSFYLKLFPQWESINAECWTSPLNNIGLSATPLRDKYLETGFIDAEHIGDGAAQYMADFLSTAAYKEQHEEFVFMKNYLAQWDSSPYPPNFVTVDNIVIQSGHILLVQRKSFPGKNLWALPGGHLNRNETFIDGSMRELIEETKIDVPTAVLRGAIKGVSLEDNPYRSTRLRTITQATIYHLVPTAPKPERGESNASFNKRLIKAFGLPKIKAADDAKKAKWVPLDEVDPRIMFEDHYLMIQKNKHLARD